MISWVWQYLADPVLRGPTVGSMLMCSASALIGVLVFLRKESLIGEMISHASYPGVIGGLLAAFFLFGDHESALLAGVVIGAFLTGITAFFFFRFATQRWHLHTDSALCFSLAFFFGLGILWSSFLQASYPSLYRKSLSYLFGQTATMTDWHIKLYFFLLVVTVLIIVISFRSLKAFLFDPIFVKTTKVSQKSYDIFLIALCTFSIVIGIRTVGVVLMSAMLIAPAIVARQLSSKLSTMLILASLTGAISAFIGNVLSHELSKHLSGQGARFTFPTGPTIVLTASVLSLTALLFAPKTGFLSRHIKAFVFKQRCTRENILKQLWKENSPIETHEIARFQALSTWSLNILLWYMKKKGVLIKQNHGWQLTEKGKKKAERIVRLHRLWEVYLVKYVGLNADRVHANAEDIEHVLTPAMEKELLILLDKPETDPHHQPIPL